MKNKKILILAVIMILMILLLSLIILLIQNKRTPKENFKYIYSDEMDEGTFSPEMIHIVIARYEGDINPKAITKASYNLINKVIPTYSKYCKDEKSMKDYFDKNKNEITLETGILTENEFEKFINEINKLSGKLKFESAKFDRESITVNKNDLEVVLKIKYKDNEEISINTKINNKKTSSSRAAIRFYK